MKNMLDGFLLICYHIIRSYEVQSSKLIQERNMNMNMFEKAQVFAGKVVVVTGGSRGIGFAAVKEFLKAGAKVCFLSHYEETGKAALAKLAEINPDYPVIWRCIDLCSEEQAKALFEEVEALWGRVDVLINNAGISNNDALVHHTMDNWKAVVDVNQTAVYNMSRYAMSALKKTEGCIINTSSVTGVHSSPSGIAYPATKAARWHSLQLHRARRYPHRNHRQPASVCN